MTHWLHLPSRNAFWLRLSTQNNVWVEKQMDGTYKATYEHFTTLSHQLIVIGKFQTAHAAKRAARRWAKERAT